MLTRYIECLKFYKPINAPGKSLTFTVSCVWT